MKTQTKIRKAFTRHLKPVKNENEYNPSIKVGSTVKPPKNYTYNEIAQNMHKQLLLKYE